MGVERVDGVVVRSGELLLDGIKLLEEHLGAVQPAVDLGRGAQCDELGKPRAHAVDRGVEAQAALVAQHLDELGSARRRSAAGEQVEGERAEREQVERHASGVG